MAFEFKEVDFDDPELRQRCIELGQLEIADAGAAEARLLHAVTESHPESFVFGAFDGPRLAAITAFVAHPVRRADEAGLAFQPCLSASDTDCRGVASPIVRHAKERLRDRGAGFLFAFPDRDFVPVLTGQGFRDQPLVEVGVPLLAAGFWARNRFDLARMAALSGERRPVAFDAHQTAEWKRHRQPPVVTVETSGNTIFGRLAERPVAGMQLTVFEAAGYRIADPHLLPQLMQGLRRETNAQVLRAACVPCAPLAVAARSHRPAPGTPLMTFPLNWQIDEVCVEAWPGLDHGY